MAAKKSVGYVDDFGKTILSANWTKYLKKMRIPRKEIYVAVELFIYSVNNISFIG